MKKQILILFTLLFVGTTAAFGQTIEPRPIEGLTHDALNPIPGTEYTYSIDVPTPDGSKEHQWFVTTNTDFIEARDDADFRELIDDEYIAAGDIAANGFYEDIGEASTLELTWKSFYLDPNEDEFLFVVIYTQNESPDEGCISDNLKVYRIEPQHAFTLDIANMDLGDDYGEDIDICPDDVASATFNPAANEVEFTYGENILEYEVVAANFLDSYELFIDFSGEHDSQDVVIEWSRDQDFATANVIDVVDGDGNLVVDIDAIDGGSVGADGEVIYLRAIITHNNYEGLADRPFTMAIDGESNGLPEINHDTGTADGFDDIALQTITARPTINAVDPDEFLEDDAVN